MSIQGKWRIVEMPDYESDFPDMMGPAYTDSHWLRPIHLVMAVLVTAIHAFVWTHTLRRGCPRQARA
jgi:uncharacterized membrane protein (UPF0182 family)